MSKVVTLRLSEEEYETIARVAKNEHRPISNYITATVIKDIEESYFVNRIEMQQINADKTLLGKLHRGHQKAKKMKGKFVE